MKIGKLIKSFLCIGLAVVLIASLCFVSAENTLHGGDNTAEKVKSGVSYAEYLKDAVALYDGFSLSVKPQYDETVSQAPVMCVEEGEGFSFKVTTERDGWYNMGFVFMPYGRTDRYTLSLMINGERPFAAADEIVFYSAFADEPIDTADSYSNDTRPDSFPAEVLQKQYLRDNSGVSSGAYLFRLNRGENEIFFELKSGTLMVSEFFVCSPEKLKSYEDYIKSHALKTGDKSGEIFIEAETPDLKSDRSIIANTDRSGPDSTYYNGRKNEPFALKLNILSDENFKYQNQWAQYGFKVEKAGFYKLSMRVRQNLQAGLFTSRRIYIDGAVPFEEFDAVEFYYDDSWYIKTVGDDNPYLVWLDEGSHTIRLEVTSGVVAELSGELSDELDALNGIYRDIFMVTGSSPSIYMDYDLAGQISDLVERFKTEKDRLKKSLEQLVEIAGGRRSNGFSVLDSLIVQLEGFVENPDTIEDNVSSFKDNCSAFGSWIASLNEQPLGIDSIVLSGENVEPYGNSSGFFGKLWFQIRVLVSSFLNDYDYISKESEKTALDIWVMNGREPAQIIKNLSKNYFEPEHNASVNVSVVSAGLVEATLAGTGPDIALFVPSTTPVFMGARGVLSDLSGFKDCETLVSRYNSELVLPYRYKGAIYGIPLTYDMPMLFYRTDIFDRLELECPTNWDEFYEAISVIQNSLMDVGIPSNLFETLLYQNGGSYFNEELDKCVLDSDESVAAFEMLTEFYTDRALPVSFDFYNRFRTGEMPMAIAAYSNYMSLEFAAPEISGLWKMAPVPTNGKVSKYLMGEGSAAVVFEKTENKELALDFLVWFTDAEVQGLYGIELEIVLGAVGRHKPANKEALKFLGWSIDERELILSQFDVVKETPVIPSNYYITRSYTNAFRKVVYSGGNPRETLLLYVRDINKEIARKQAVMEK